MNKQKIAGRGARATATALLPAIHLCRCVRLCCVCLWLSCCRLWLACCRNRLGRCRNRLCSCCSQLCSCCSRLRHCSTHSRCCQVVAQALCIRHRRRRAQHGQRSGHAVQHQAALVAVDDLLGQRHLRTVTQVVQGTGGARLNASPVCISFPLPADGRLRLLPPHTLAAALPRSLCPPTHLSAQRQHRHHTLAAGAAHGATDTTQVPVAKRKRWRGGRASACDGQDGKRGTDRAP